MEQRRFVSQRPTDTLEVQKIEQDRAELHRRSQEENARWQKQRAKLETALRRASD